MGVQANLSQVSAVRVGARAQERVRVRARAFACACVRAFARARVQPLSAAPACVQTARASV